jgi:hypothetical protein
VDFHVTVFFLSVKKAIFKTSKIGRIGAKGKKMKNWITSFHKRL